MTHYVEPTEQLVTAMFVRDIRRSVEFYRKLGFELVRDDGGFVELAWEGHLLFFNDAFKNELPASPGPLHGNIPSDGPRTWMTTGRWLRKWELGSCGQLPIGPTVFGTSW